MSTRRKPPAVDADTVMAHLEALRAAAMEAGAFAPALRAIELLGRHVGMWRDAGPPAAATLEQLVAASLAPDKPE